MTCRLSALIKSGGVFQQIWSENRERRGGSVNDLNLACGVGKGSGMLKVQILFLMHKADKHPLTIDGVDNRYCTICIQL